MTFNLLLISLLVSIPSISHAFCGFYVAKADASLYNQASQVVFVRNENKTVISMMNDFKGNLSEFAMVIPVPQILQKEQIHIGDKAIFEHLDAYSAPRLVEYFDPDPCQPVMYFKSSTRNLGVSDMASPGKASAKSLGVKIEAEYTVGEYDIVILSAKESDGLETWLIQSGYKIPKGARKALKPYILQDMKFFVAKVNIKEQAKTGVSYLRPIQFAFESEKFMLPIRLGMINANGPQDLLIYVLTKNGRAETTNYRTVKLPSDLEVPAYIKSDFSSFYKAMFETQVKKENMRAIFTEYFWNMGWCDPCAADPLSNDELRQLGVFWINNTPGIPRKTGLPRILPMPAPAQAMVTRLHVRYSRETFPEDLMFQETQDQQNYQGRFIVRHPWRHPWKGEVNACEQAKTYVADLGRRHEAEAQTLARLTGWEINDIRKKMGVTESPSAAPFWKNLWK